MGKTYKGQTFVPVKTIEDVAADLREQAPYVKEGAVAIQVWFSVRGHRDQVLQQSMLAYTRVRSATLADWDQIFAQF